MSATVAIVAATSASNAAAAAAASAARDAECRVVIRSFDAHTATPSQQYEYADCVNRFRPASDGDVLGIKVAIVVALLAAAIGAWWGWQDDQSLVGASVFAIMGVLGAAIIALILYGIAFVVMA